MCQSATASDVAELPIQSGHLDDHTPPATRDPLDFILANKEIREMWEYGKTLPRPGLEDMNDKKIQEPASTQLASLLSFLRRNDPMTIYQLPDVFLLNKEIREMWEYGKTLPRPGLEDIDDEKIQEMREWRMSLPRERMEDTEAWKAMEDWEDFDVMEAEWE